ncbi:dihydrodipicolinate synthase family protein [Robbsia sp. KACC 23696]|uniref:dihydrodipicolinate synthase family protein n=1 Tax=Robbsia sp. KACC 23696 TaxID=3149231 RepID=UPI00325B8686
MMISGIWLPLVTPFKHGEVDLAALQKLIRYYAKTGISGFVALGTTGESALLSPAERLAVLETFFDVVPTGMPVFIGVGGMSTAEMCDAMSTYRAFDPAGYLIPAPAYIRPDQDGLLWHFSTIADAAKKPIILYDVPVRSGVALAPETVEKLLYRHEIVAIKACVPASFTAFGKLPLSMLCGTDAALIECLLAGGSGGILASAHVFPEALVAIDRDMRGAAEGAAPYGMARRRSEASLDFDALTDTIRLLFSTSNPTAIKACLALAGLARAETRPPLTTASDKLMEQLSRALSVTPSALRRMPLSVLE